MRYSLKTLFIAQAVILVCCFLLIQSGIIQIHYPKVVHRNPLIAPIKVLQFNNNNILLADGRNFRLTSNSTEFAQQLLVSDYLIDLETSPNGYANIYVNDPGWLCGTPWAQGLITIPLIADEVSTNRRTWVSDAVQLKSTTKMTP